MAAPTDFNPTTAVQATDVVKRVSLSALLEVLNSAAGNDSCTKLHSSEDDLGMPLLPDKPSGIRYLPGQRLPIQSYL